MKAKGALICQEREYNSKRTGNYYLVPRTGNPVKLDFGIEGAWPLASLKDKKYILLQERTTNNFGTKEVHPLWIYDMSDKKLNLMSKDVYMTSKVLENIKG